MSSVPLTVVVESRPAVRTSAEWVSYFLAHLELRRPIPWEACADLTPAEAVLIGRSLQAWQRGETSDGMHLRAVAARYAEVMADPELCAVIECFIAEENRHSELMGRFLDETGLGRIEGDWTERLFRWLRHRSLDMAAWTTPVLLAEVMALVYYDALKKATTNPALQGVCGQILGDEAAHIRFQTERFATLFHGRSSLYRRWTLFWQGCLFLVVLLVVWCGHRQVLRAGGYGIGRYWSSAWKALRRAWKMTDPARYDRPRRG